MGHFHLTRVAISLLEPALHRHCHPLAGHRQHPTRLIDHAKPLILKNNLRLEHRRQNLSSLQSGVDLQPLEHPPQHRATLSAASRIGLAMPAHLPLARPAIPILSDGHGVKMIEVGRMQQLRRAAFSRSRWGYAKRSLSENLAQTFTFSPGIEHHEIIE